MRIIQGHNAKVKTYERAVLREPGYDSADLSFPREVTVRNVPIKRAPVRNASPQQAAVRDLSAETLTVHDVAAKVSEVRSGGRRKKWKIQELFSSGRGK